MVNDAGRFDVALCATLTTEDVLGLRQEATSGALPPAVVATLMRRATLPIVGTLMAEAPPATLHRSKASTFRAETHGFTFIPASSCGCRGHTRCCDEIITFGAPHLPRNPALSTVCSRSGSR